MVRFSKTKMDKRNKSAINLNANPYVSSNFKESELIYAANLYQKLDKSGNLVLNKTFAQTIFNESVARISQNKFKKT